MEVRILTINVWSGLTYEAGKEESMTHTKLTILFTESSKSFGGQQRRLITEARLLRESGHKVEIACPRDSVLAERAVSVGIPVNFVPMPTSVYPPGLAKLLRLAIRLRPDVLYSHSGHDSWLSGIVGLLSGISLVRSRELLTRVRSSTAYILPRRVLACGEAVKAQLVDAGVPDRKIFIHYPPIETARFSKIDETARAAIRREKGAEGKFPVIFCSSEFRPEKRQEDLVRALGLLLPEFPSALLVLAGTGRTLKRVQDLARDLGVDEQVRFLGEREDIPALLSVSDIYAFVSDLEPFGMGAVEAMAAGVPVIATGTGGLIEIMEEGKDCILVPPRDPKAVASALAALSRDKTLRDSLSAIGCERARFFDAHEAMNRLLGHFYAVERKK
jgi:glycosyltransferase involved in cell wall biosynthesis